jgi:Uma2 family endonuclease
MVERFDVDRLHLMEMGTALLTVAEYARLDEPDDGYVSDLVRGVVVREPRPGPPHGRVQMRIGYALEGWARRAGADVTAESGYILSDDPPIVRGPDVAVVLRPRSGEGEPGGWIRGAPDVVVEVLSPSDTSTLVQEKTLDYLEAGAKLVWLVDPRARTVTVIRPDGSARILRKHETLEGEDVLSGFTVPLVELFAER